MGLIEQTGFHSGTKLSKANKVKDSLYDREQYPFLPQKKNFCKKLLENLQGPSHYRVYVCLWLYNS